MRGLGVAGGWKMMIEDRSNAGYKALEASANKMMGDGNQQKGVTRVFSTFNTNTPALSADMHSGKAVIPARNNATDTLLKRNGLTAVE